MPSHLLAIAALALAAPADDPPPFLAGFGKVDVTPEKPLRLSGYADRAEPFAGIDAPIFARAMALRSGDDTFVLVSLDTIGFPPELTETVARRLAEGHGVTRERFALCATHSHTTPQLLKPLLNLYTTPLTDTERARAETYTRELPDRIVGAVDFAIADLSPARLATGVGEVGFAVNRRVLRDGKWIGFGVNPDGPVDHSPAGAAGRRGGRHVAGGGVQLRLPRDHAHGELQPPDRRLARLRRPRH